MDPQNITISSAVQAQISRESICAQQVFQTVCQAEKSGIKFRCNDELYATARFGYITVWVKYHPISDGFLVTGLYYHRMSLTAEEESHNE